jgi:hypothetical protein
MAEDDGSGLDLGQDIVGHDDLDELENQLMGQSEQSKDVESEMNGILDGLKEASELDDGSLLGSQNKGVGNFLQKFEHKATKKSGLLNQDGPIMDLRGRFGDELGGEGSELENKSNAEIDSILDSGNFCNDENLASPY